MKGVPVVIRQINLPSKDLVLIATQVAENGGVAMLVSAGERANVVITSGKPSVNASEIIGQVCGLLGGKGGGTPRMAQGGGPEVSQLDLALKVGRERITAAIND